MRRRRTGTKRSLVGDFEKYNDLFDKWEAHEVRAIVRRFKEGVGGEYDHG